MTGLEADTVGRDTLDVERHTVREHRQETRRIGLRQRRMRPRSRSRAGRGVGRNQWQKHPAAQHDPAGVRKFGQYRGAVTLSGKLGSDAKPYQEKQVRRAIEEAKNEKE